MSSKNPFSVGDRVRVIDDSVLSQSTKVKPKFKIGDTGTVVSVGDDSIGLDFDDKSYDRNLYIHGGWMHVRFELIPEEPEYTVTFPIDIFDPKVFYTKEAQEKMWQSTTGTKWPYKDSR